jgi:hypothetical protein
MPSPNTVDVPSRNDNPFATCWTKPGAIPFIFPAGKCTHGLVEQLAAHHWRGEIIGPHGSGKSTLLVSLKPALEAAGCEFHAVSLHTGQRHLPHGWATSYKSLTTQKQRIVIIDGYEQLGWWARLQIRILCLRQSTGLLVTSHLPTGLPTLIQLAPDRQLLEKLVAALCSEVSSGITPADAAASHACHGSNVRDILFDLYDRHERWRRKTRTRGESPA